MSDADDLDRYADLVAGMPRERLALLRAGWPEARKVFSDEGLVRYLRAIRNLEAAGVTWSTVVTFLREAPRLAQHLGGRYVYLPNARAEQIAAQVAGASAGGR